jgi:hypothetical protein
LVHDHGHPTEAFPHLVWTNDVVMEPVRQELAGYPESCPVLHECGTASIKSLRTTDPLLDPSHDVAEDRLDVQVDLLSAVCVSPFVGVSERKLQHIVHGRAPPSSQFLLAREDVDPVVVNGVQDCRGRRGNLGCRSSGTRVRHLLLEHVCHEVGRRAHAFADLGTARHRDAEPRIHVVILV